MSIDKDLYKLFLSGFSDKQALKIMKKYHKNIMKVEITWIRKKATKKTRQARSNSIWTCK